MENQFYIGLAFVLGIMFGFWVGNYKREKKGLISHKRKKSFFRGNR